MQPQKVSGKATSMAEKRRLTRMLLSPVSFVDRDCGTPRIPVVRVLRPSPSTIRLRRNGDGRRRAAEIR